MKLRKIKIKDISVGTAARAVGRLLILKMTSLAGNIFEAQKICRKHRDRYRWSIVGPRNMTLTVLFPEGYTNHTHYQIIDEMNKSTSNDARCYFKVEHLKNKGGGFNLKPREGENYSSYIDLLRNKGFYDDLAIVEDEWGDEHVDENQFKIHCNLLDEANDSKLDSVLRTSYKRRNDTNIVTYKADSNCPLIHMMILHQMISSKRGVILDKTGYPKDDDDIWSSPSIWH